MPETELITIGEFARSCGLSASALRFYADAGVLVPAVVDESTGYRYYTHDQTDTARLVRHLRAVEMPLPAVTAVLAEPDPTRAARLLDTHLADLDQRLREVRTAATAARTALHATTTGRPAGDTAPRTAVPPNAGSAPDAVVWVSGPLLAAAVDQVAAATVTDPQWPVLDTIQFEVTTDELTLTATDRIRLATRTLRPTRGPAIGWTATVDATDLRSTLSWLRRQHSVAIHPGRLHVEFAAAAPGRAVGGAVIGSADHETSSTATNSVDGNATAAGAPDVPVAKTRTPDPVPQELAIGAHEPDRRRCRRSPEVFPDYRAMLAALPPARTRVVLARAAFLTALEESGSPVIALCLTPPNTVALTEFLPVPTTDTESPHQSINPAGGSSATRPGPEHSPQIGATPAYRSLTSRDRWPSAPATRSLPAVITGPAITIHFAVTTLYPAVAAAVGPDVMLDLIAPDLPAGIRSADDGDLFTLAMPCRPEPTEEPAR
ncbi:MerR family transcriptional regulator [Nocardia sp. NPDC058176]|uniref:DNA polymerase III subunit beta family protein n=1 Tax=Nocardia sp. NPDC058176 TaxID=3346368 RepID=UPI0036DF107C